jgi:hypothetical protein
MFSASVTHKLTYQRHQNLSVEIIKSNDNEAILLLSNFVYTCFRAVASMYSWGGVGQKFPNDEKNFRIFHGIRSHEGVCYPENEDAVYKQKYT